MTSDVLEGQRGVGAVSGACCDTYGRGVSSLGNRRDDHERVYPRSEVALRHGAGAEVTTAEPERRGRWEVKRPERWDELPWSGVAH